MTDTFNFNGHDVPAVYETKAKDDSGKTHTYRIDFRKVHPDYVPQLLLKATQRFVNDGLGSAKENWGGSLDLRCAEYRKRIDHINSGEAPQKVMRKVGASLNEAEKLAHRMAKEFLRDLAKSVNCATIAQMAQHEAFGAFFKTDSGGNLLWDGDMVAAHIEKMKTDGKRDYLAEAEKSIADRDAQAELYEKVEDLVSGLLGVDPAIVVKPGGKL